MKEKIKVQAPSIAIAALLSTTLTIALLKSPLFPVITMTGVLTGGALAFTHEGSPNRKARELKAKELELKKTEADLSVGVEALMEEEYKHIERINQHRDAALEDIAVREAAVNAKLPTILQSVEALKETHQAELEQVNAAWEETLARREGVLKKVLVDKYQESNALKQPDLIDATCFEDSQANDAIRALALHGIVAKEPIVQATEQGFTLSFKVLPRLLRKDASKDGAEAEIPFSVAEAGKIIQNRLLNALRTSVAQCEREPTIDYEYQRLRLIFDTRPIHKKQRIAGKDAFGVTEPDESHFVDFMAECSHLAFFGNTGRGKSVAIRNAFGAMAQSLGGDVELVVGDPKFTEAMRDLNPQFVGSKECLLGIRAASEELTRRLEIREEDYRAGRPYQQFSKIIYFFDEINELLANFNKPIDPEIKVWLSENELPTENAVSIYLSRLWRLSREVNIVTLVAGQNLKPTALKINVVELGNFGMVFFGDAIQEGINYRCKGTEGTDLTTEYQLRRKRAKESEDVAHEFYALYAPPNQKPYFAALPKPKMYALNLITDVITGGEGGESDAVGGEATESTDLDIRTSLEALLDIPCEERVAEKPQQPQAATTPKKPGKKTKTPPTPCPHCGSSNTRKNGKGRAEGTIRILCKDCGKSSTVSPKG